MNSIKQLAIDNEGEYSESPIEIIYSHRAIIEHQKRQARFNHESFQLVITQFYSTEPPLDKPARLAKKGYEALIKGLAHEGPELAIRNKFLIDKVFLKSAFQRNYSQKIDSFLKNFVIKGESRVVEKALRNDKLLQQIAELKPMIESNGNQISIMPQEEELSTNRLQSLYQLCLSLGQLVNNPMSG